MAVIVWAIIHHVLLRYLTATPSLACACNAHRSCKTGRDKTRHTSPFTSLLPPPRHLTLTLFRRLSLTRTQHAARSSVTVQPHVNLAPTLAHGQNTSQLPNSSTQSSLARTHFSHLQRSLRHPRRKCPPSGLALHLPPHLPTWIRPRTRRPPRAAAATLTTPACTPSPPPRSTTRTPPTMRVRRPHTQTLASAAPTHSPPITPRTGNRVGMA